MEKTLVVHPHHTLSGIVGLSGRFSLPGDKSLSHRAALFAALADGMSRIDNFLVSGVTTAMLNALTALGVRWKLSGTSLLVQGHGLEGLQAASAQKAEPARIDCGNSATTMRLLAGAIAAAGVPAILDGSAGLRKRPMGRIVEPLQAMGVPIQASPQGTAPLSLGSRPVKQLLQGIDYVLPVASAQVKSALLLAALAGGAPSTLREPGPSRDHTERMLLAMGVKVEQWIEVDDNPVFAVRLSPPRDMQLKPLRMRLPCDISSAAFLIVAALITPGSEITIQGVGLNPTRTGLIDALKEMAADIEVIPRPEQGGEPTGDLIVRHSNLVGGEIHGDLVVRMIDEFPAFSIAAAYAKGTTVVTDAQELRYKESDRISALCTELRTLGVEVRETPDGFVLRGGKPLRSGIVDPHGDHRLAMSLAIAGLGAAGTVRVQGANIIHESFPEFVPILKELGAVINLQ